MTTGPRAWRGDRGGSAGQIIGAPIAELLLAQFPWQTVFIIFAGAILCALFALPLIRAPEQASTGWTNPWGVSSPVL